MIWNNGPLRSEFPAAPGAGGGESHPDEELRFDEADFNPIALPREAPAQPAPASETAPAPAPAKPKKVCPPEIASVGTNSTWLPLTKNSPTG